MRLVGEERVSVQLLPVVEGIAPVVRRGVEEHHVVVVGEGHELGQVLHAPGGAPHRQLFQAGEISLLSSLRLSPRPGRSRRPGAPRRALSLHPSQKVTGDGSQLDRKGYLLLGNHRLVTQAPPTPVETRRTTLLLRHVGGKG